MPECDGRASDGFRGRARLDAVQVPAAAGLLPQTGMGNKAQVKEQAHEVDVVSYAYSVYGLRIRANRAIPGLIPASDARPTHVDVELLGCVPSPMPDVSPCAVLYASPEQDEQGVPYLKIRRLGDASQGSQLHLRWAYEEACIEFWVDPCGERVWGTWSSRTLFDEVVPFLLGPVMGCVLCARRIPCLHASAVAIDGTDGREPGAAVAILGPKCGGKSTLAAALAQRGHAVLSDDVAVLFEDSGSFMVQPGYPRMRLWPNSIERLPGLTVDALPRVWPRADKRCLHLEPDESASSWRFHAHPLPLVAVYVLSTPGPPGTVPSVTSISSADSLISLAENAYMGVVQDRVLRARNFEALARVVSSVPVRQLCRPLGLDALPQARVAIEQDLRHLGEKGRLAGL